MNDPVLIAAVIGVVGALLAGLCALLATLASDTHQKHTEQRTQAKERLDLLEKTYEDVLTALSNWIVLYITFHPSLTEEEKKQMMLESNRYKARLQLVSTPGIVEAYLALRKTTADVMEPQKPGKLSYDEFDAATQFGKQYDSLALLMQQHLESVHKQAI